LKKNLIFSHFSTKAHSFFYLREVFFFRKKGNTRFIQKPHTEQLMLGIRSHRLVGWRGIRLYGKEYLPNERTGEEHLLCVCVCVWTWGLCAKTQTLQTHMREYRFSDSRIPDIPSCEFPVRVRLPVPELWHHEGVPLCSHNHTHIWKWEEGNPRWWLKGIGCQGDFLSTSVFFAQRMSHINVSVTSSRWRSAGEHLSEKTAYMSVAIRRKRHPKWSWQLQNVNMFALEVSSLWSINTEDKR